MQDPEVRPAWQFRQGPGTVALVAAGGAVGTAARFVLTSAVPSSGFPVATFGINLLGAFALGVLLETLNRHASPRATAARLLLGTGVLGGFTTYSSLAVDTASLTIGGAAPAAALYALGTLVLGIGAAALGISVARPRRAR